MSAISHERSSLEQLAAARLRGAGPDELLDLADAAIERATAAEDGLTLELIAAELDSAATAHPEWRDGLRVAAQRARAALPQPARTAAATPAAEAVPSASSRPDVRVAGFGRRSLAFVVDNIVVFYAFSFLVNAVAGDAAYDIGYAMGSHIYVTYPLFALWWALVFALEEWSFAGRTVGKWVFGIAVRSDPSAATASGGPAKVGFGTLLRRETFRAVLALLLFVPLIIDGLAALRDPQRRTWHDRRAGTLVVRAPRSGVTEIQPISASG